MALELKNFKEVGGPGNSLEGGQLYTVFSDTDDLGTMLDAGYLDGLSKEVNARDIVILSARNGIQMIRIFGIFGTTIIFGPDTYFGRATVALEAGPTGVMNQAAQLIDLTTTGVAALTLADGTLGQQLTVTLISHGGNGKITPASALGFTDVTLGATGDTVTFLFRLAGWIVMSKGGLGTGPTVA